MRRFEFENPPDNGSARLTSVEASPTTWQIYRLPTMDQKIWNTLAQQWQQSTLQYLSTRRNKVRFSFKFGAIMTCFSSFAAFLCCLERSSVF